MPAFLDCEKVEKRGEDEGVSLVMKLKLTTLERLNRPNDHQVLASSQTLDSKGPLYHGPPNDEPSHIQARLLQSRSGAGRAKCISRRSRSRGHYLSILYSQL